MNPVTSRTPAGAVEDAVLDAAAALLAAEGPGALNIRRIATEASVSPMSIYNRFGDKAGLLDALFRRGFGRLREAIDAPGGPPGRAQLRAAATAYRAFAVADPGTYSLLFDRADRDFEPSEASLDAAAASFERLVAHIRGAQAAGELVGGNPVELAQRVWASIHGAVSLELREICFAPDTDAHFAALVDTLLVGLAPEGGVPGHGEGAVHPKAHLEHAVHRRLDQPGRTPG